MGYVGTDMTALNDPQQVRELLLAANIPSDSVEEIIDTEVMKAAGVETETVEQYIKREVRRVVERL